MDPARSRKSDGVDVHIGVVGVGVAGSSHLFDLASNGEFEIAAVCASRPHRAAEAAELFGARAWRGTVDELIADGAVDAVVVATPPAATPAIVGRCLAAGLPTLVDKPAAGDARSLQAVVARAGAAASLARVGYNRRYQRHVAYAGDLIRPSPDDVMEVRCRWAAPFTVRYTTGDTFRAESRFGDGVILDTATHIFDTLAFLGLSGLRVCAARLHRGGNGTDVGAYLTLGRSSLRIDVEITDSATDDDWCIDVHARWGHLTLSAAGLRGSVRGEVVSVEGDYFHRPVEDLLRLPDGRARGATLAEAVAALELVDQARVCAFSRRRWRRPRAKALGRLNGAC